MNESRIGAGIPADSAQLASAGRDTIPGLVRQLANDVSTLVSKELSLAKAEFREAAEDTKAAVASIAIGAAVAMSGLIFVLLAIVYALSEIMEPWLASLLVGVAALAIGMIMAKAGQKKLEPDAFVPERTVDSLQKDKDLAKRVVS